MHGNVSLLCGKSEVYCLIPITMHMIVPLHHMNIEQMNEMAHCI